MAKNPRRVAAGRINGSKRGPRTLEELERLRELALANRPWQSATGPRTPEGKARSAANGRREDDGELSIREAERQVRQMEEMVKLMVRSLGLESLSSDQ